MERWKDVVGYEGLYQVSDLGRVRSVDRVARHSQGGAKRLKGQICGLVLIVVMDTLEYIYRKMELNELFEFISL